MKIKSKLIIGLSALILTFGIALGIGYNIQNEIHSVADYHNYMSIPALEMLQGIALSFADMNGAVHESIAMNKELEDTRYSESFEKLNNLILQYDALTWEQGDDGLYFAPEMMRDMMQARVGEMIKIKNQYHANVLELFSNDNANDAQSQLIIKQLEEDYEIFHQTIEGAIQMELGGKTTQQGKIHTALQLAGTSHIVVITISGFLAVIISLLIIKGINTPITKIRNVANQISKGNFNERLEQKGSDEFQELSKDINTMSEQLECNRKEVKKQERLLAIGELSARIAHDVRNPLSAIKTSVELIQDELPQNLKDSNQERFRIIDRGISRISHQVEDVLDYVRERALTLSSCNVSDLIKQSFANLSVPKNVKMNFELSNSNIVCDIEKMETVITNLLMNAVQALEDDGQITVKSRTEADSVIITIEDSGEGIPESIQDKIFDPLFTTKQMGTGLGLASCKKIVENHKGTITYSNNPSTFTVVLPQLTNPLLEKN